MRPDWSAIVDPEFLTPATDRLEPKPVVSVAQDLHLTVRGALRSKSGDYVPPKQKGALASGRLILFAGIAPPIRLLRLEGTRRPLEDLFSRAQGECGYFRGVATVGGMMRS